MATTTESTLGPELAARPPYSALPGGRALSSNDGPVAVAMLLLGGYVALFDFILVNVVHFFTRLH